MGNNLPTPKARLIGGVAYVPPIASIAFLMANGIPIDDISISCKDQKLNLNAREKGKVHNVSDCRKSVEWKNAVRERHWPSSGLETDLSTTTPTVILLGLSDWTDGFGPGKVKNNRNSVDIKSFTISPPKASGEWNQQHFSCCLGTEKSGRLVCC